MDKEGQSIFIALNGDVLFTYAGMTFWMKSKDYQVLHLVLENGREELLYQFLISKGYIRERNEWIK